MGATSKLISPPVQKNRSRGRRGPQGELPLPGPKLIGSWRLGRLYSGGEGPRRVVCGGLWWASQAVSTGPSLLLSWEHLCAGGALGPGREGPGPCILFQGQH